MYQFTKWCFLCASETDVEVDILSLEANLREIIGQFSIINFTLMGVPSKICCKCLLFLKDYEARKEQYSRAEQMFMELLKTRSKTVDVSSIRAKYNLEVDFSYVEEEILEESNVFLADDGTDGELAEISNVSNKSVAPFTVSTLASISPIPFAETEAEKPIPRRNFKINPVVLNPTIQVKIRSNNRIELFKCDLCSHKNSTKFSMERHMKQIHLKRSSLAFQCETCWKIFAKKSTFQNHLKIHMTSHRPTYDCQHCGKVLSSKTAVSNHIKWLHNNQKEFKCSSCPKTLPTKQALIVHQKVHSDVKVHDCPICQKSFKTASTLVQHIDTHGETEYHCNECDLRLNSKRTLRQHMIKHNDVIKHTCQMCNAQFKRTKTFKEHLISQHTEIRAYSCDWCSKTFSNGANCRKHKKDAHPKELSKADESESKKIVRLPKIGDLLTLQGRFLENSQ